MDTHTLKICAHKTYLIQFNMIHLDASPHEAVVILGDSACFMLKIPSHFQQSLK